MVSPYVLSRRVLLAAVPGMIALAAPGSAKADDPATQRYICVASDCTPYIYDPVRGDPESGIPPGTPFAALPDDWFCPDCGASKADFIPLG